MSEICLETLQDNLRRASVALWEDVKKQGGLGLHEDEVAFAMKYLEGILPEGFDTQQARHIYSMLMLRLSRRGVESLGTYRLYAQAYNDLQNSQNEDFSMRDVF